MSSSPPETIAMNRRYAYRDYAILVTAQPAGDRPGWRPEVCVIAPDDHWEFVPMPQAVVANDAQYCLELGRRCGENAIQDLRIDDLVASYGGFWH